MEEIHVGIQFANSTVIVVTAKMTQLAQITKQMASPCDPADNSPAEFMPLHALTFHVSIVEAKAIN